MNHPRSRPLTLWLLLISAALAASVESITHAQTLRLGDPEAPAAAELTISRLQARRLREEAAQWRSRADSSPEPEASARLARAQWREVAAVLLDQPDPLASADLVLRGWAMWESADAIDQAVQAAAGPFASAHRPVSPAECARVLESLIGVLTMADSGWLPAGVGAGERFAHAEAIAAGDADLASVHDELIRLRLLSEQVESRLAANAALDSCIGFVEIVEHLDQTAWIGAVWKQNRQHALAQCVELLVHPRDGRVQIDSRIVCIEQCVRRMDALLGLGPADRPRLDAHREALLRWMNDALLTGRERPWPLLISALDAMLSRRRQQSAPTQRELRAASAALDRQSDAIERRMGELLASGTFDGPASDPNWATLIGQHRRNTELQQVLLDLPGAVERLAEYDRRATAALWPHLLQDARQIEDPLARDRFTQAAELLVRFDTRHHDLPGEADWRSSATPISEIVGDSRRGALARLDSVRRLRAAELIAGSAESSASEELESWRDVFRLVELWRRLASSEEVEHALNRRGDALLPAGFVGAQRRRLESAVERALALSQGGTSFVRAVEEARRQSAGAVIADALAQVPAGQTSDAPRALAPLLAAARSIQTSGIDSGQRRVMQWCVLQFEVARRTDADGPAPRPAVEYAQYLGERLAHGEWTRTP
ncbi:MAG: hypothetical protein IT430_12180 [Phycisphaerales bacterium]|nr:hypothetical protein [Phycisphaerales bacterium]